MDGFFLKAKGVGFKALRGGFSFFLQLFSEMYFCRQLICSTKGLFGKSVGWVGLYHGPCQNSKPVVGQAVGWPDGLGLNININRQCHRIHVWYIHLHLP